MIFDAAGNLYGTTLTGGIHNAGSVFKLSPQGNGSWTARVLHSFNNNGSDGYYPYGSLIADAAGNFYGTTLYGGIHRQGTVFELSPNGSGGWTEKILHSFYYDFDDGAEPYAGLIMDERRQSLRHHRVQTVSTAMVPCSNCRPDGQRRLVE